MKDWNSELNSLGNQISWPELEINKLVGREKEIESFTSTITAITYPPAYSDKSTKRVLELTEGPGLGKSQLRRLLVQKCQQQNLPNALINFADLESVTNELSTTKIVADPTLLFKFLINELEIAIEQQEELNKAIQCFQDSNPPEKVVSAFFQLTRADLLYRRPDWIRCLDEVVNEFIAVVENLSKRENRTTLQPVIFFFDETQLANRSLVDWLEEYLIVPLLQRTESTLVIWLARRPWNWKQSETRNHLSSKELEPFTLEESKKQLEVQSTAPDLAVEFFRKAQKFNHGHPSANYIVAIHSDLLAEQIEVLQTKIYRQFIAGYALGKLDLNLRVACELLSLVRFFDTGMLRHILKAWGNKQDEKRFETWSRNQFSDLLSELKRTLLVRWKSGRGYEIEPSFRDLIRDYYANCQPDTFNTVHEAALEIYTTWLESEKVENRISFILEEVYHLACLQRRRSIPAAFKRRLKQFKSHTYLEDFEHGRLEQLIEELVHDKELAKVANSQHLIEQVSRFQKYILKQSHLIAYD